MTTTATTTATKPVSAPVAAQPASPAAPIAQQHTPTPSHGGRYLRAEDGTLTPVEE